MDEKLKELEKQILTIQEEEDSKASEEENNSNSKDKE